MYRHSSKTSSFILEIYTPLNNNFENLFIQ